MKSLYRDQDEYWMQLALSIAKNGIGLTSPNPPVGAVIVKNNKLISSGWHKGAGLPHAEVNAILKHPRKHIRGATLYVTLEPCCTWGKTPPCTDLIINEKIRRVVIGCEDPNPIHSGKGINILRRARIDVRVNVCHEAAKKIIIPFQKKVLTGMPFVTLKMGLSLDGRIADNKGYSRWITCYQSRRLVKRIRQGVDAIIIGGNTAQMDNPSLLSLHPQKQPLRIVLLSQTHPLTSSLRLFNDKWAHKTILVTNTYLPFSITNKLTKKGTQIWCLNNNDNNTTGVSLMPLLHRLGERGCLHVLVEGGGTVAGSFVAEGLIDRYLFFIAPIFLGASGKNAINGYNWLIKKTPKLHFDKVYNIHSDILVIASPFRRNAHIVYDSDILLNKLCLPA